jgi:hypothetical protein
VEVLVSPQPALPLLFKILVGLALESLFLATAFRPVAAAVKENPEPIP